MTIRTPLAVLALLTATTMARTADKIPGEEEIRYIPGKVLPRKIVKEKDDRWPLIYLACKNYPLIDFPDEKEKFAPRGRPGADNPVKFMEAFYIAGEKIQHRKENYHLLVKADVDGNVTSYEGWVDSRYLAETEALKDPNSHIHYKAMTVTHSVDFKDPKKPGRFQEVPVYLGPDLKAEQKPPIRLWNIRYIFAEFKPPQNTNKETDSDQSFVLIGSKPSIDNPGEADHVIGWVPESRVCRWFTREAFDFHPDRASQVEVYSTPEDAYHAWSGQKTKRDPTFVSDRPSVERKPRPRHPDALPFFVLKWPNPTPKEDEKYKKLPNDEELKHVGIYAGVRSSETGQEIVSSEELQSLKRLGKRIAAENSRVQVLFVIDDTSSMGEHIRAIADVFDEVVKVAGDDNRQVDVAVTFYKDLDDGDKGKDPNTAVRTSKLRPLRDVAEGLKADMRSMERGTGGGDILEQMLRGLTRGIRDAEFTDHARKMVVLLGDFGHNTKFDTREFPSPTEEEVAKLLNPGDGLSPIELVALQVVEPRGKFRVEEEAEAARDFRDRIEKILKLSKDKRDTPESPFRDRSAGRYRPYRREQVEEVRKEVKDGFTQIEREAREVSRRIEEYSSTGDPAVLGPELLKRFEGEGWDREKLAEIPKGVQVFETGYLASKAKDGTPLMKPLLLVQHREIEDIVKGLSRLEDLNPNRRSLADLIPTLIQNQSGEKETIGSALIQNIKGLEFKPNSLLNRVAKGYKPTVNDQDERMDLLVKMHLLKDLTEGFYQDHEKVFEEKDGIKYVKGVRGFGERVKLEGVSDPKRMRRAFNFEGTKASIWYWIDYEKEWP